MTDEALTPFTVSISSDAEGRPEDPARQHLVA